jgi:hypothetical protein
MILSLEFWYMLYEQECRVLDVNEGYVVYIKKIMIGVLVFLS